MAKEGSKSETLLLTSSEVDMSKHVGHKVMVTGMAVAADRPVGTSGAIDAKPGTDSAMTGTGAKVPAGFHRQILEDDFGLVRRWGSDTVPRDECLFRRCATGRAPFVSIFAPHK